MMHPAESAQRQQTEPADATRAAATPLAHRARGTRTPETKAIRLARAAVAPDATKTMLN